MLCNVFSDAVNYGGCIMTVNMKEWVWKIGEITLTGGGLLWMWLWTFRFHKLWGISWLTENLLVSQEGLYSLELVGWLVR